MGRMTTARAALIVGLLLVSLTGCQSDAEGGDEVAASAPRSTASAAGETPGQGSDAPESAQAPDVPLAGSWIAHYERARATEQLKAAGLGKWTEAFFEAEAWPPPGESLTAVYTFTPSDGDRQTWEGTFAVAYFEVGDFWKVGWAGSALAAGRQIEMHDDFSQTTDVFGWQVKGDELTLQKVRSDAKQAKGLPVEVYDVAYLSDPLTRTDCPMDPATDCPR